MATINIQAILLDSDDIAFHLRKAHDISHKEYNSRYYRRNFNASTPINFSIPGRFMTLKKDDKTAVKKENLKIKVVQKAQKQEIQKEGISVKIQNGVKDGLASEKTQASRCNEVEKNVVDGCAGPSIDGPGPSFVGPGPSGKVVSPEERERNLQELFRQQRNFLRRLLADTDDEDEPELLPNEEDQDQEEQEVD